ncbi:uncharacterized protein LOC111033855 [Myzus persicae]|uniref:uncharacterized protein LOC111033855 n=1 Tax=Myzus persicae TaxID=13164 RepID=UPI000B934151|nr:uncharacterized protein LOC111033855 [Myzus persicae]
MNSAINDPANKVINVINEHNDPKINEMARRIVQSYSKNESTAVKQTLAIAPTINNQEQLYEDILDIFRRFGVEFISNQKVPYIIRVINGEKLKFVSIRMAEAYVLKKFLDCLNPDIYACTSVKSYFITDNEALLLDKINQYHAHFAFGKKKFLRTKDCIVRIEDVHQMRTFMEVCYTTFACNIDTSRKQKCGLININNILCSIPYCIKDNQKYIPLLYFQYLNEEEIQTAVKFENWDLAYLKLCCKVHGINDDLITSDSCMVVSLDDIKTFYSTDLNFEDFWPLNIDYTQFINVKRKDLSGTWIRRPVTVVPAKNNISRALTASATVTSNSIPVMMNTNQNGQQTNKMRQNMLLVFSLCI